VVEPVRPHFYSRPDKRHGAPLPSSAWPLQRAPGGAHSATRSRRLVRAFYPGCEVFAFVNVDLDMDRKGSNTEEILEDSRTKDTSKRDVRTSEPPAARPA